MDLKESQINNYILHFEICSFVVGCRNRDHKALFLRGKVRDEEVTVLFLLYLTHCSKSKKVDVCTLDF